MAGAVSDRDSMACSIRRALAPRGRCRDQPNQVAIVPLAVDNDKYTKRYAQPQQDRTLFVRSVVRVRQQEGLSVFESASGFSETAPCFRSFATAFFGTHSNDRFGMLRRT